MFNSKERRKAKETATLRRAGLSLSHAARNAQRHQRKSGFVLLGSLLLSAGYIGVAAVFGLQAVSEPPADPVRVTVEVPVPAPLTAADREQIYLAERARRAPEPVVVQQAAAQPATTASEPGPDETCVSEIATMASGLRILFAVGSVTPETEALQIATGLAAAAQTCPEALITVEGHSDATGDTFTNLQLSWARAENTIAHFDKLGFDTSAFTPIGHGTRRPAAEGDGDPTDAINRRVEFAVARRADTGN